VSRAILLRPLGFFRQLSFVLVTLQLPAAAWGQEQGFLFAPPQASSIAKRVDSLFYVIFVLALVVALGVCLTIIVFCFRYRQGTKVDRSNPPDRNMNLEVAWILTPVVLSMIVFVWSARVFFDIYQAPPGSMQIYVVGKQWMWKLQHPEGQREINELHIPIDRPVSLVLSSQDVIHSFFVPAFRIKQDAVPGRTTTVWFEATQPGKYHLFCAQYCGVDHSRMAGWVFAMKPADYQQWLRQTGTGQGTMAAGGAKLFQQFGCSGCHVASTVVRAPVLNGLYGNAVPLSTGQIVTADDSYIHDAILLPNVQIVAGYQDIMPSYKGVASEFQVLQLIAYIKSLPQKSLTQADGQPDAGRSLNGANRPEGVQEARQNARQRMEANQQPQMGGGNR